MAGEYEDSSDRDMPAEFMQAPVLIFNFPTSRMHNPVWDINLAQCLSGSVIDNF